MLRSKDKLACQTHVHGYQINYAGDLSRAEVVWEQTNDVLKTFTGKLVQGESGKSCAFTDALQWAKKHRPVEGKGGELDLPESLKKKDPPKDK